MTAIEPFCYTLSMDIYNPERWREFFLLVGTGAVALTGLVFVAMSLNPKVIFRDVTHRYRAVGTLAGLAAVFLRCSLALMGDLNHKELGAMWLIVAGVAGSVNLYGYIKSYRSGSGASVLRTIIGTTMYLIEMTGALIFISGSITGLYLAATVMVINSCYMISGAWLLVMGVFKRGLGKR